MTFLQLSLKWSDNNSLQLQGTTKVTFLIVKLYLKAHTTTDHMTGSNNPKQHDVQ